MQVGSYSFTVNRNIKSWKPYLGRELDDARLLIRKASKSITNANRYLFPSQSLKKSYAEEIQRELRVKGQFPERVYELLIQEADQKQKSFISNASASFPDSPLNQDTFLNIEISRLMNGLRFFERITACDQGVDSGQIVRRTVITLPGYESLEELGGFSFFMDEFSSYDYKNSKAGKYELCDENRNTITNMHFMPGVLLLKYNFVGKEKEQAELNNKVKLSFTTSLLKLIFLLKNDLINNKSNIFSVKTNSHMQGFLLKLGFEKPARESFYEVQISRQKLLDNELELRKIAKEYLKREYLSMNEPSSENK